MPLPQFVFQLHRLTASHMKPCLIPIFALSLIALSAPAAEAPATPPGAPAAHPHKETTELGEHMGKIGRAFRALSKSVSDPAKNADSLKLAATIRTNAEAALELKPAKLADIPDAQRDAFLADYRQDMKRFLGDIASLEAALKSGNNTEAAAVVKKMKADMDEGHKEFRKKKPDDM
jgi:soluble cytochrome b562